MTENLTIASAAKYAALSKRTILRSIQNGHLKSKKNSNGHYVILENDFKSFLMTQKPRQEQQIIEVKSKITKEINKDEIRELKDENKALIHEMKEENKVLIREMKEEIKAYREEIKSLREENKALRHEMLAFLTNNFHANSVSTWTRSGEGNKKDSHDIIEHVEEQNEQNNKGYSLKELETLLNNSKNTVKRKLEVLENDLNTKIETVIFDKQGTKHYIINDEQIELLKAQK